MKQFLLGIPSYNSQINIDLVPFLMECAEYCDFMPVVHRTTDVARNQIIRYAQCSRQHVIMVDADSIPHEGTAKAFVEKILSEECIVCAPYCSSSGHICINEKPVTTKEMEQLKGWTTVNNCGTHTVGYNISVFDRIERPYFEYDYNRDKTFGMSEDYVLHRKLSKQGVPIYCNWDIWSNHVCNKVWDKPRSLTESEKMLFLMAD